MWMDPLDGLDAAADLEAAYLQRHDLLQTLLDRVAELLAA